MHPTNDLCMLFVGDGDRCEFRAILSNLRADMRMILAADLGRALQAVDTLGASDGAAWPDLVLLAQSRPGEYADPSLNALKMHLPLARFLFLLGSWCEGESRTGHPWPGAERIYWYDWPARWSIQRMQVAAGRCPVWGLPETATGEERLLWTAEAPIPAAVGDIIVHGRCQETMDAISDACHRRGYRAQPYSTRAIAAGTQVEAMGRPGKQPLAAIWEGTQCDASESRQLARFARLVGSPPVIALLDFPRAEDAARAHASGAARIVSKPYLLEELFWHIDRCGHPDHRAGSAETRQSDVAA